jgi:hypothetical protein
MDPITIIVTALALGAAAGLQLTAEQAVKDAYAGIKRLIQDKYQQVSVALLEADPASEARQNVVKEDLAKAKADQDEEVLRQAQALLDVIEKHAPEAAEVVGVDLKDIKGASLTLQNIIAAGSRATGVRAKGVEVSGDIEIKDVQAGNGGASDSPKS